MAYDIVLLKGPDTIVNLFRPELQKGFYISSHQGSTVFTFLTGSCGISENYISEKVKTVLIDGGPVDDIFNIEIKEGGVCAVSGAMPGIVGAMMRIGSPYAAMRESITARPRRSSETGKEIVVELKLFNVVLSDMGLYFLKKGILLGRKRVYDFFKKNGDELYSVCREVMLNGLPVENRKIMEDKFSGISELVILKVGIDNENNC